MDFAPCTVVANITTLMVGGYWYYGILIIHVVTITMILTMGTMIITYASTQPHAYAYGGAAQLEVGSLPVSVSWPLALHCHPCLTHCSPGNVPNPTPGPLMSAPLINTGQLTLYHQTTWPLLS